MTPMVILLVIFSACFFYGAGFFNAKVLSNRKRKTSEGISGFNILHEYMSSSSGIRMDLLSSLKFLSDIAPSCPGVLKIDFFRLNDMQAEDYLAPEGARFFSIPSNVLEQIYSDMESENINLTSLNYKQDSSVVKYFSTRVPGSTLSSLRIYAGGNLRGYLAARYLLVVYFHDEQAEKREEQQFYSLSRLVYFQVLYNEVSKRLKDSQEFLDGIFNKNSIAMCITDIEGKIQRYNRSFSHNFSEGMENILNLVDRVSFEKMLEQPPLDQDFNYNFSVFHVKGVPLYSMNGSIRGTLFTIWDDTLQHTLIKKLETSEERYRQFLQELPVGLALVNDEGVIGFANDHFLVSTGYSGFEKVQGKNLQNIFEIPFGEFRDIVNQIDNHSSMLYQFYLKEGQLKRVFSVSLQKIYFRDEEYIEALFQDISLENRLYQQLQDKTKQIQEEIATARRIWEHILSIPPLYNSLVHFETFFRPSSQLGGDFYDVLQIDEVHTAFIIADVSGHGVSASLITAMLKMLVEFAPKDPHRLDDMVGYLNHVLVRVLPEDEFITLFYGILDTQSNTLEYINCGHPFPFIYDDRNHTIEELQGATFPLGTKRNAVFGEYIRKVSLPSNCRILLYTDGLLTFRKGSGMLRSGDIAEIFRQSLGNRRNDILNDIYMRVVKNAVQFTEDDVSMLLVILNRDLAYKKSLSIPSNVLEIDNAIVKIIENLTQIVVLDEDENWKLYTSLYEAIINAVEHGNKFNVQKRVTVIFRISGDLVAFRIRDEGIGFDPKRLPDPLEFINILKPSGRGVYMIRKLMLRVKYNTNGNEVTMFMRLRNSSHLL